MNKEYEKKPPNPILKANFLSKWFFVWTREIFNKGLKDQLETKDIYEHVPTLDSGKVSSRLAEYWEQERKKDSPSILRLIFKAYGWTFVPICVLYSILEIAIHSFQPLFLGGLVSYFAVDQIDISKNDAYLYAMGIVLCSLVGTLCFHPFMFFLFKTGTKIRVACAGLVYRKCLRAAMTADNSGISGMAIAVLSTDLPQFDLTFYFFHDLWKGPVEACVFGYLMYRQIGWPALIGIAVILLFIPLQAWAAKAAAYFRQKSAGFRDDRVNLMNEIITAIQVIKMYAWEQSFGRLVAKVRKDEIKAIRGSMNIYAALQCTNMISRLSLFLSLVTYVFTGDFVTAKKVFIVFSYYNMLNDSLLHFWPLAITTWAETLVCAKRVEAFLTLTEEPGSAAIKGVANKGLELNESPKDFSLKPNTKARVELSNLKACWDRKKSSDQKYQLNGVDMQVSDQQFVGVVGNVGAGKTTLLNVLLGELEISEGLMSVNGKISYAPQQPWVFEGTIRDNIIFVEQFDERRYKKVLTACQLDRDLEILPFGDQTVVGERGISLSGGQKARVSLARAVYKQADIYLLDDPLAALDAQVGMKLFEQCFLGFLHDKTRILVTHYIQLLKHTDSIVVIENTTTNQAHYTELSETPLFKKYLANNLDNEAENEDKKVKRQSSLLLKSDKNDESETSVKKEEKNENNEDRKEQQMQGSVKLQTYMNYFNSLGMSWVIIIIMILFVLARGCQAGMDYFIAQWATWEEGLVVTPENEADYDAKRVRVVIYYTILIVATLILYLVRTFAFFFMCQAISLRLHDKLYNGIIRAYMYFFQNNPSGRILNRFSSDITSIDVALPQAMLDSFSFIIDVAAVLIIVAVANYWLLVPAALMIVLLYLCRYLYIGASRSLKRIESMTRSPVYSHTNQTFQGLVTIRALNAKSQLETEFHNHQNHNTSALFLYVTTNRAFAFWTDLICVLYIFAVTFSFLILDGSFNSGDVGLAITQSMTLVIMCQWGMRQTAEMENNMTSVERVTEYANTPSEPPLETPKNINLSKSWPHKGQLKFKDLSLRYTQTGDKVLKGLNLSIEPLEKIGIVGRTGAGKSSIIQAIFRLAFNEGLIDIDGHDIDTLGLTDLRSRISIIPQDPVLFSGTLRFNLDPLNERNDEEMWRALENVKLKDHVMTLDGGLDSKMLDGGSNFSMGQRQLLCMARALLRNNRILIMDEATANVDSETDNLIQETIKTKFQSCTVLTIAHRLNTVMGSDKVLVMDAGQVVEMGPPYELLQNQAGFLYKLVQQFGKATAAQLLQVAELSYKNRVIH